MLHWIGFRTEDARNALVDDAFGSYDDVKVLTEEDISTMATNFSDRTGATGRIYFCTRRIKYLKAFTHWILEFYHTSGLPTIVRLSAIVFKSQLYQAAARADIRKNMADQTKTSADAASPGPL